MAKHCSVQKVAKGPLCATQQSYLRVNKGLEGKAQFHWLTQKVTHEPRVNARVDCKYSLSGELYLHQSTMRSGLMPGIAVLEEAMLSDGLVD